MKKHFNILKLFSLIIAIAVTIGVTGCGSSFMEYLEEMDSEIYSESDIFDSEEITAQVDTDVEEIISAEDDAETEESINSEIYSETEDNTDVDTETADDGVVKTYPKSCLKELKNTRIFTKSAIEHIFEGQINAKGNATGYHYDMIEDTAGRVIEGTEGPENEYGVYTAKVEVNGTAKTGNKGYSTFYAKNLTPQEVVDLINEAYNNRVHLTGNTYAGETADGMEIEMYLTDKDKIISAFPVY